MDQNWVFRELEKGSTARSWDVYAQTELLAQFIEEQAKQQPHLQNDFKTFIAQRIKDHRN